MDRESGEPQGRNKTIGVTGHRPKSLGQQTFEPNNAMWSAATRYVESFIKQHNASRLISGGALGFDMVAGRATVAMDIELELALPFEGYDNWNKKNKKRLDWLIERAAHWHYVCEPGYDPSKYQIRNQYIVDNCDTLLAFWNGEDGGTGNCVKYAHGKGVSLARIVPDKITEMI